MVKAEFLMSGDVARLLAVSYTSVARLVKTGHLQTAGETPAGYRLFRRTDVEDLMKARKKNPPRRGRPKTKGTKTTK